MHKLSNKNPDAKTADCEECGPGVEITFVNATQYPRWYCLTGKRTRNQAHMKEKYLADPVAARYQRIKNTFSLSREEYDAIYESQDGKCKLCTNEFHNNKDLHIDHDHSCCPGRKSCGKCVRGLLCSNCNTGIGLFKDNRELLLKAASYLDSVPS
jgi:hypothetical protein